MKRQLQAAFDVASESSAEEQQRFGIGIYSGQQAGVNTVEDVYFGPQSAFEEYGSVHQGNVQLRGRQKVKLFAVYRMSACHCVSKWDNGLQRTSIVI